MKKFFIILAVVSLLVALVGTVTVAKSHRYLTDHVIRLHVVANSDSQEDQAIKLRVRDAVIHSISQDLEKITDVEAAKQYIQENLPKIQKTANDTLKALGCTDEAVATLKEEVFDTRFYDTFTLPAGVYEALRITIGEGKGQNWWCVAFPTLCVPATAEGFEEAAVAAGFSEDLTDTLEGEYEIRFYLLDLLGRLEGILWNREN